MNPAGRSDPEMTRKQRREAARAERVAQEASESKSAARRRWAWLAAGALAVAAVVALAVALAAGGGGKPAGRPTGHSSSLKLASLSTLGMLHPHGAVGQLGPEGVPIPTAPALAGTASKAGGEAVDAIECSSAEQTLFHIHAHLTVFVNGAPRQVPYGIGIPNDQVQNTPAGPFVASGSCFYWLHTHAADGIIHIESPVERTYKLGEFFNIWGQPLSSSQVGPAKGAVTVLYNGRRYEGDPREVPLTAHAQVQLDVGTPLVAPVEIAFPNGL
jgi:hypothetical protein